MFSSEGVFRLLEHLVFIFVIAWLLQIFLRRGTSSLLFGLFNFFKETIPGFHILVKHVLKKEVTGFVKQLGGKTEESKSRKPCVTIPKTGNLTLSYVQVQPLNTLTHSVTIDFHSSCLHGSSCQSVVHILNFSASNLHEVGKLHFQFGHLFIFRLATLLTKLPILNCWLHRVLPTQNVQDCQHWVWCILNTMLKYLPIFSQPI